MKRLNKFDKYGLLVILIFVFYVSYAFLAIKGHESEYRKRIARPCKPTGYELIGNGQAITYPCGDTIRKTNYKPYAH